MVGNVYSKLREPITAVLLILAAIALVFYPAVFQGQLIYQDNEPGSDSFDLNIPRRYLAVQAVKNNGEIALWEPKIGCGVPLFAESEAGVFHPSIAFFFLDDLTLAADLTVLSAIFIAVAGCYCFCRCLDLEQFPSAVAAAAFGFGETFLLRTAGLNIINVICWLPFCLAFIHLGAVSGKKRYWFALVSAWTFQLSASHMQMFAICQICCWLYIGFLLCTDIFVFKISYAKFLLLIISALLFAVSIGAVQLLTTQELTQKSIRCGDSQTIEQLEQLSPTWKMLLIFVNPFYKAWSFLGSEEAAPRGMMCFYASDSFQYVGVMPFLLSISALFGKRKKLAVCLWIMALFFMLTAMGPRLGIYYVLWRWIPYMNTFRMPGRFAVPLACWLAVLAAVGAQNIGDYLKQRCGRRISESVLAIMLLIVCADLGYVNSQVQGYLPPVWCQKPPILQIIGGHKRIYSPYSAREWTNYFYGNKSDIINRQNAFWQHKCLLSAGIAPIFGIETPDDFVCAGYGIVQHYSYAIQEGLSDINNKLLFLDEQSVRQIAPNLDNWFRIQAVSHIITPMPLPKGWPRSEFSQVQSYPIPEMPDSEVYVYTLAHPVKEIRLVPVLQTAPPANCIDLEQYLQIRTGSLYEPDFAHPADIGTVTVENSTNNTLTLTTSCERDAFLVISRSFDSNWQAAVDGNPAFIRLTNLNMQSLPVPKGQHRVELRYVSPAFERGLKISLFSLIAFILLGIWAVCRRGAPQAAKQSASPEPEG